MSNIKLVPVKEAEKVQFIKAIQVAFQKSYETTFGHQNALVLPSSDIEASFNTPGSRAYFAFLAGSDSRFHGIKTVNLGNTRKLFFWPFFASSGCS